MKHLVIANWKMNPQTLRAALKLAAEIERGISGLGGVEVAIAPPFPFLAAVKSVLRKSRLGAQNLSMEPSGALTGEVSAAMLRGLGVSYVIIGHSERRRHFGESDELISRKVRSALAARLTPIIAVGEELPESEEVIPRAIADQLSRALAGIPKKRLSGAIIVYEPVWAIGTGRAESPDNATSRAIYIRKLLVGILGRGVAETVRILYGGSVTSKNAAGFISYDIRGMEGLLVGGASLNPNEFVEIVKSVGRAVKPKTKN